MKLIKDKKYLIEMLLKTNLIYDAMCIVYNIRDTRIELTATEFASTNGIRTQIKYILIDLISTDVDDDDTKIKPTDLQDMLLITSMVHELREFIFLHLHNKNTEKLQKMDEDKMKKYITKQFRKLNNIFNNYIKQINLIDNEYFKININKYYITYYENKH